MMSVFVFSNEQLLFRLVLCCASVFRIRKTTAGEISISDKVIISYIEYLLKSRIIHQNYAF
jgi:hypothetical protein